MATKTLSQAQIDDLLQVLKTRFDACMDRHKEISWDDIRSRLESDIEKMWSLNEMELTGGEPDVIGVDEETGEYLFVDCSAESPKGRRNVCYDNEALNSRKANKTKNSAAGMAADMGIELLTEAEYRTLQEFGEFDTKTSSWVKTPPEIRKLGGAVFCDRRYDTVFLYHNGAESYYSSRGFRGILKI